MALSCPEPYPVKRIPIEWTCLGFISTWRGKALQVVGCSFMAVLQPNPKPFHNVFFVPVLVWGSKPRGLKHVHVVHCPCWDMRAVPCWKTSTLEHVHFVTVHIIQHFQVGTFPCWNMSMLEYFHVCACPFFEGGGGCWNMSTLKHVQNMTWKLLVRTCSWWKIEFFFQHVHVLFVQVATCCNMSMVSMLNLFMLKHANYETCLCPNMSRFKHVHVWTCPCWNLSKLWNISMLSVGTCSCWTCKCWLLGRV